MRSNQPSKTARKVALNIVTLGAKSGMEKILPQGIAEATGKMLLASGVASETTIKISRSELAVSIYEWFDWMLPGQFEAFAHRKTFCENQVREAIRKGATQVLVLGAGYDTLGWRLAPEFSSVKFFEIDHPATGVLKARGIKILGRRENLYLICEDLGRTKLVNVLEQHSKWDKNAKTIIIAEGLLMYLPPTAVRDLFVQTGSITGLYSRFVFSCVPADDTGRPDIGKWTGLVLWILKAIGEPWLWSIRLEELSQFMKEAGWFYDAGEDAGEKYGVEFFGVANLTIGAE